MKRGSLHARQCKSKRMSRSRKKKVRTSAELLFLPPQKPLLCTAVNTNRLQRSPSSRSMRMKTAPCALKCHPTRFSQFKSLSVFFPTLYTSSSLYNRCLCQNSRKKKALVVKREKDDLAPQTRYTASSGSRAGCCGSDLLPEDRQSTPEQDVVPNALPHGGTLT